MRHLDNERGFTLPELLVATAIIGIVMAGVFIVQRGGQSAYLFGSSRVETQQNARVALDLMTRELRSATSITALSSATDITFVRNDEAIPPVAHTIRYALTGTTLNRTVDGTTTPLIGGIDTLAITPYKEVHDIVNNTYTYPIAASTDAALVRMIKISLKTRTEGGAATGSAGDARSLMESTVTLRSMIG